MSEILKELNLPWSNDVGKWYILGYVINYTSFWLIDSDISGYLFIGFSFEFIREIISKLIYGNAWTAKHAYTWFSESHKRLAIIYKDNTMYQRKCKEIEEILFSHPRIARLE
jgi:hypothetical protein